jgi:peptidoglycan-associated lipoprotein
MTLTTKAILIIAALALAACNNPRRGAGTDTDPFGLGTGIGTGPGMIGTTALGDPNDPTSIAHFNERIGDTVRFETDSSSLTTTAQDTLRRQAMWLNQNSGFAILIEGHADERGTREYNIALGERRANAVRQFLAGQGVAAGRIRTVSYGKERPVEACAAPRCWELNRRAVTAVSR